MVSHEDPNEVLRSMIARVQVFEDPGELVAQVHLTEAASKLLRIGAPRTERAKHFLGVAQLTSLVAAHFGCDTAEVHDATDPDFPSFVVDDCLRRTFLCTRITISA